MTKPKPKPEHLQKTSLTTTTPSKFKLPNSSTTQSILLSRIAEANPRRTRTTAGDCGPQHGAIMKIT
jgi:hypothetical protein